LRERATRDQRFYFIDEQCNLILRLRCLHECYELRTVTDRYGSGDRISGGVNH
jgi:hypothetical protein